MEPTLIDLYNDGWSLIPINSNKQPMLPSWKPYQSERATLDQIQAWASDLQPPIWAGVTGRVSGVFTVDFDGEPGRATLAKLGWEPHRSTPGGGDHVNSHRGTRRANGQLEVQGRAW